MYNLDKLPPAGRADLLMYMPYYSKDKHSYLPLAISLYQQGSIEGTRRVEGIPGIPFVASWSVTKLPSELTSCRLQFDGQLDLNYQSIIVNSDFVGYLIDVMINHKRYKFIDFPAAFYRKLLRPDDYESR